VWPLGKGLVSLFKKKEKEKKKKRFKGASLYSMRAQQKGAVF
jgi:hypothetical protein